VLHNNAKKSYLPGARDYRGKKIKICMAAFLHIAKSSFFFKSLPFGTHQENKVLYAKFNV
jgi:hypothetical protein